MLSFLPSKYGLTPSYTSLAVKVEVDMPIEEKPSKADETDERKSALFDVSTDTSSQARWYGRPFTKGVDSDQSFSSLNSDSVCKSPGRQAGVKCRE